MASLLVLQLCLPSASLAQFRERRDAASAAAQAAQAAAQAASAGSVLNLDLSSTARNISASNLNLTQDLNINVGGMQRMVTGTDLLTAAEFVAAHQVQSLGNQTLRLGSDGNAVGGRFSLSSSLTSSISNLVVPENVKLHQDFAQLANLSMTGDLINSGKFVAFSSSPMVDNAVINANNIYNQAGATLTTLLPQGGLPAGMTSAVSNMNLTLNALGEIVNQGTISSAGNLTMSAGGNISNTTQAGSASLATMQALGNVNLASGSGVMTNSGLISSLANNINVASVGANNILIHNYGGTLSALTGSINVRDSSFDLKKNISILGGDLLSQQVNAYSGTGITRMNVNSMTGAANVYAGEAHILTENGDLNLGVMELSGDPTYFSHGNITISSNLNTAGADLAIVAGGDITTGAPGVSITTGGGQLNIIAGANFTSSGAPGPIVPPGAGDTTSILTIDMDNPGVGNIDLTGGGSNDISALSSAGTTGGAINLIAFGGTITVPTGVTITSSGTTVKNSSGVGGSGNVTIIAGAATGTANAISIGDVDATNSTNGYGGQVYVVTSSPQVFCVDCFDNPQSEIRIQNGKILNDLSSGNSAYFYYTMPTYGSPGTIQNASISTGSLLTNNAFNTSPFFQTPYSVVFAIAGANLFVDGDVSAVGVGQGYAGDILLDSNIKQDTQAMFTVGSTALVNGLTGSIINNGGSPGALSFGYINGNISIQNYGTGGITVSDTSLIQMVPVDGNGPGLDINAMAGTNFGLSAGGPVYIAGGTLDASGVGSGDQHSGGAIGITGTSVTVTGTGPLNLLVNSAGTGTEGGPGGSISIGTNTNISIGGGDGQFTITGHGAAYGSGVFTFNAGGDIDVDPNYFDVTPSSPNVNGSFAYAGQVQFYAGNLGVGNVRFSDSFQLDGNGAGRGGYIIIRYNDPLNPMTIGGTGPGSYIDGDLVSLSPLGGTGGGISLENMGGTLSLNLSSLISTGDESGATGSICFNCVSYPRLANAVAISGSGTILGAISETSATSFSLDLEQVGTQLSIRPQSFNAGIGTTAGDVSITTRDSGSSVYIVAGSGAGIQANGNLTIVTPLLTFGASTGIGVSPNSRGNISITVPTVAMTAGSTATIFGATGGTITVGARTGTPFVFDRVGGASLAELYLDGAPSYISSAAADTTINSNVKICSNDNTVTLTVTAGQFINNGTLCTNCILNLRGNSSAYFQNANGSVSLPGLIDAGGGAVAAIAGSDIWGTDTIIRNASSTYLLAGAAISNFTVTGSSASPGNISGIASISTTGEIVVASFGGGTIEVGDLTSQGNNVQVYSQGNIHIGNIQNNQGSVDIQSVNPDVGGGITFTMLGTVSSGSVTAGAPAFTGSVYTGNIDASAGSALGEIAGGSIYIQAGLFMQTGYLRTYGAAGSFGYQHPPSCCVTVSNGGSGGSITLYAPSGGIIINGDVNSAGGGGGGNDSGPGYDGGAGGNINIDAHGLIEINGPVIAAGGGGGGGGANLTACCSTGGGGGSLGAGGGPTGGGIFVSWDLVKNPLLNAQPGEGGLNSGLCCGSGSGGDVGQNGQAGTDAGTAGGLAGLGGAITLSGRNVAITETIGSYYGTTSPYDSYSLFNWSSAGGGDLDVTITNFGPVVSSTEFNVNMNLSSSSQIIPVTLVLPTYSVAGLENSNSSSVINNYSGPNEIILSGDRTITNGINVTPAEWVALVQESLNSQAGINLNGSGVATSGFVFLNDRTMPGSNFTSFTIPATVIAKVETLAPLAITGSATINGTLDFSFPGTYSSSGTTTVSSGATMNFTSEGTISAPTLTVNGSLLFRNMGTMNLTNLNITGNIVAGQCCQQTITINALVTGIFITGDAPGTATITAPGGIFINMTANHVLTFSNKLNFSGPMTIDSGGGLSGIDFAANAVLAPGSDPNSSLTDLNAMSWSFGSNASVSATSISAAGAMFGPGSLTTTVGDFTLNNPSSLSCACISVDSITSAGNINIIRPNVGGGAAGLQAGSITTGGEITADVAGQFDITNTSGSYETLTLGSMTVGGDLNIANYNGAVQINDNKVILSRGSINIGTAELYNDGYLNSNPVGTTGSISVSNPLGDLYIGNIGYVSAAQGGLGNQGSLSLSAAGNLDAEFLYVYLDAPSGNYKGGDVNLYAETMTFWESQISVNGSGTGSGGSISITTTGSQPDFPGNPTSDIVIGNGNVFGSFTDLVLSLSAIGGTLGGSAGSVFLSSGTNLTVDPAFLSLSPGVGGSGGTISLTGNSTGDGGNIQVTGGLNVNASVSGNGHGGSISIIYNDSANDFLIGSSGANSFINGSLSANGAGTGNGGSITILGLAGPMSVINSTQLSATGTDGSIFFQSNSNNLSLTGNGFLTADAIGFRSTADVTVNQLEVNGTVTGQAAGYFSITTLASLTLGNILAGTTGSGSITATMSNGSLNVADSAQLFAQDGITLQNLDTVNGTIAIGQNASIGASLGDVYIVIGSIPGSPITGSPPANTTVIELAGGQAYFGTNGITDTTPQNTVLAYAADVVFDTNGLPAANISLGGGTYISANNTFTPTLTLDSLDLTDPTVTANVLTLQGLGEIGGTLITDGFGIATGGNLIISPSILSGTLSSENIPQFVTLTMLGFSTGTIDYDITASSTTKQVLIEGTHEFKGSANYQVSYMTITTDQSFPALEVTSTGILSYQGNYFALTTNGDIAVDGALSFSPGARVFMETTGAGNINITSTLTTTPSALVSDGDLHLTSAGTLSVADIIANGNSIGHGGGADIILTAAGDISTGSLQSMSATTNGSGGVIDIESTGGSVTLGGFVDASSRAVSGNGGGGDVSIQALGDISIVSINAIGNDYGTDTYGGSVSINSTSGSLIATSPIQSFIDVSTDNASVNNPSANGKGYGGSVDISVLSIPAGVNNNLTIRAEGGHAGGDGGFVTINMSGNADLGFISTSADPLGATSGIGKGGDIDIFTNGTIAAESFRATGGITSGSGGNISVTSNTSSLSGTFINAGATNGSGGNITLYADGNLTFTGYIASASIGSYGDGGAVSFYSANGSAQATFIDTASFTAGTGGSIIVNGKTGVTINFLTSYGGVSTGDGGNITVTSQGDISVLQSGSAARAQAANAVNNAGNISITTTGGSITMDTSGLALDASADTNGKGGSINISASVGFTASGIRSSGGSESGNSGSINLTAIDIQTGDIQSNPGLSGDGGNITVTATGNFSSGQIYASGGGYGNGGVIDINATGNIDAQSIYSNGGSYEGNSSSITLVAGGFIDTGVVSTYGNSGNSADVSMTAGGTISANVFADAGPYGSFGGNITLISTGADIAASNIDSDGYNYGTAGDIVLQAATGISVTHIWSYGGTNAGNAGDVSLSTTSGAIDYTFIEASAFSTGGTAGNVSLAGDSVSGGYITTFGATGIGNAGNISITATGYIDLSNYIDASAHGTGSGGNVTLSSSAGTVLVSGDINTSGRGSGYVAGNIQITYNSANAFVVDPIPSSLNGVIGSIFAQGTSGASGGTIAIANTGANMVLDLKGTISVTSDSGASGTIAFSQTGTVTILGDANGELLGPVSASGSAITVDIQKAGSTLNLGSMEATAGSITITLGSSASTIRVLGGAGLSATEGNIILENDNVSSGSIILEENSQLGAVSTGSTVGKVIIVMGPPPGSPLTGSTPANTVVNSTNGGVAYFGTNSISDQAPTNTITVDGGHVIFNTDTAASSAILLGGNVAISSTQSGSGPVLIVLDSLDLTDPAITTAIQTNITNGFILGSLTVNGGGVATGGTITLDPSVLAPTLTGENIPANVTVELKGFLSGNPLDISVTATSYTNQVIISGTHAFIVDASPSDAFINVTSDQTSPYIVIASGGILSSDAALTVTANGSMSLGGNVTAGTTLSMSTTANNGNIAIASTLTGTTSVSLSAHGTGSITQTSGSISTTGTLSLTTAGGNIGSPTQNIVTNAPTITASTGGGANASSVYINSTAGSGVTFSGTNQAGTSGTFFVNASNNIVTGSSSTISAATVILNSVSGSIGTSTTSRLEIAGSSTTNLTASAPNGAIYIDSAAPIALQGNLVGSTMYANATQGNFDLTSAGQITSSFSVGTNSAAISTIGSAQEGLAYNPSGTRAYLSHTNGLIDVIDTSTNVILTTITSVGTVLVGITVNPAGTLAYVADYGSASVKIIDLSNNTVSGSITVGTQPIGIAFNPTGTVAYVTNFGSNSVSVINTSTNLVTATITVGATPATPGMNSSGSTLYVPNYGTNTVSVIDTATNTVSTTITVGNNPSIVRVSPNGQLAYVTNRGGDSISIISTATNTVSTTIIGVMGPLGVAFNPSGTMAYITNNLAPGYVSAVDTTTNTVVSTMPTTIQHPWPVDVNPSGAQAYVGIDHTNQQVNVINIPIPTIQSTSGAVTLSTSAGAIGSATTPVSTKAATLTINSASDAYVSNVGSTTLAATGSVHNSAVGTFQVATTPDLTTGSGRITVNDTVTVSGGTINLQSSEGQWGSVNQGGIVQQPGASLTASTVNLNDALFTNAAGVGAYVGAGTGSGTIGTSGQNILTTASTLTARTQSDVYVTNLGAVGLGTSFAGFSSSFNLTTTPDGSGNGGIQINSAATVSGRTILLTSSSSGTGSGSITQQDALTTATIRTQTGQSATSVFTATGTGSGADNISLGIRNNNVFSGIFVRANAAGSVTLQSIGDVGVATGASSAGTTYALTTTPDSGGHGAIRIVSGGTITAPTVNLTSSSTGGGIGWIGQDDAITTVTINAATLNVSAPGTGNGTFVFTGNPIQLGTTNGTSPLTLNANSTSFVNIRNVGSVNLSGASTAGTGQAFTLNSVADSGGNATINFNNSSSITANTGGSVTLDAKAITTGTSTTITAVAGNINLTASTGSIAVGTVASSSVATGSSGDINITALNGNISATVIRANGVTSGTGGDITIEAGGSITTSGNIETRGKGTFASGILSVTAGTNINLGANNLLALCDSCTQPSMTVTAGGSITAKNIDNIVQGGNGNGGDLTVIAGGDITTPNGGIYTWVAGPSGNGGNLTVTSGGNITADWYITSNGGNSSGDAGDMNVSAAGNIYARLGIISWGNGGSNGGDMTLVAGGSITTDSTTANRGIDTSSYGTGGTGNAGTMSLQAGTNITANYIASASTGTLGNGAQMTLVSTNGNITSVGAIYSSSASGNGGDMVLRAPNGTIAAQNNACCFGDNDPLYPISASGAGTGDAGNITLQYSSGSAFIVDGTNHTLTNGAGGGISAAAAGSGNGGIITLVNSGGDVNVTLNDAVTAQSTSGTNGSVNFNYLQSGIGSPPAVNPASNVNVTGNSSGQLGGVVFASGVTIDIDLPNAPIILGNLTATNGSASVVVNGDIVVVPGSTLSVTEGDLLLQDLNTVDGAITIGEGSTLSATTTGSTFGNVYLVIGTIPVSPVYGWAPAYTFANQLNGGKIYFGANGIGDAPTQNTVTADGGNVIFNTASLASSAITLDGDVTINATAAPHGSTGPLGSLDLTDPSITSQILALIAGTTITGTLDVDEFGVATGGNITIAPSVLANTLVGYNIPENVTVNFQGFTSDNQITINLTGASYTTQAVLSGTQQFSGGGVGLVVINSNQAGPVLQINDTGSVSGDGGVSIAVGGNVVANGIVSSTDNLTVRTVAGNGGIAVGANIAGTDLTILTTQGSGSISRTSTTTTTGVVSGTTVSLNAETGSIGTGASNIQTATSTLTANTLTGSAFITNTGALNLATSSVGSTLQVLNNNAITTTGAVNAGIVKLTTTANNGSITVDSNVTGATSTNLTTQGTGIVTINSTRTVATTLGNVNVIAYGVDIQGAINSGTRSTQLRPNSNENITIANTGASADPFEVSATELSRITAGTLLIGDFGKNAPITLAGNMNVSGSGAGAYSLVFVSGGTYTPNAGTTINLGTSRSLSVSTQGAVSTGAVTGGTFISFSSAQAMTVNDDITVGTNGTIIVRGTSINITGTLNAPTGEIQLAPYGTRSIALGGTGGNAQFEVTNAFLSNISANSLVLGDAMVPGGITVIAGTNLSATNVSQYNLQNGGNITNAGTLTMGLKSMLMHAQGSVTSGTINGGTFVSLQAQTNLDVNGAITMSGGSFSMQAASVNLTGSINVGQGIVYFVPSSDVAISVGGASGSAPFAITDSMLASVTATAVAIGNLNVSGGLTVEADLNPSSSYNLYLLNAGPISTAGQTITVGSRTLGIQSGSTVTTGAISASGGQVTVLAGGTLTVDGAITNSGAGTVTLATTAGSNGDVVLNASVSGGNIATLSASGSGDISQTAGTLSATSVVLSSGTGNIGTSSAPLDVVASNLRANTAGSGTVFAEVTASSLTLGSSSAGTDLSVTASGNLTVGSIATLNGDITLVANGALLVQPGKIIFANEGNLVLQNTNTASGTIVIGLNSELEAYTDSNPNKGNVTIFIGTVAPTPTNTTAPANVDVNAVGAGQAYFGANSILALKPGSEDNVINAIDRDVVFDTGSRPASAITLEGNNVITADPPVRPIVSIQPSDSGPDSLNMTNGVNLNPTSGGTDSGSTGSGSTGSGATGSGSTGSGSTGSGSTGSGSTGSGSTGSGSTGSGSTGSGSTGSGSTGSGSTGSGSTGSGSTDSGSTDSGSTGSGSTGSGSTGSGSTDSGSTGSGTTTTTTGGRNGRNGGTTTTTTTTAGGRSGRNSGGTTTGTTGGTTTTSGGRSGRNSGTTTTTDSTTTTTSGGRSGRTSSTTTTSGSSDSSSTTTTGRKARTNVPVAFTPVTTTPGIFMISVGTALVEYSPAAQLSAKEIGVVSLDSGEAMIIASDDTVINTGGHQITVAGGTIAHISQEDGVTKVRNLYEQTPGSKGVRALVDGQLVATSAGTEIIASFDANALNESVKKDAIGRRQMQSFDVGGAKVATCEISLVSLVPNSDLLPLVMHSKQKNDRAIAEKLIKMAACLSTATSSHGPYKSGE